MRRLGVGGVTGEGRTGVKEGVGNKCDVGAGMERNRSGERSSLSGGE